MNIAKLIIYDMKISFKEPGRLILHRLSIIVVVQTIPLSILNRKFTVLSLFVLHFNPFKYSF